MRGARVLDNGRLAGILRQTPSGYAFTYDPAFLATGQAISLTLPLQAAPYESPHLFAFFHGLLSEGSTLAIQQRVLKIDDQDLFGLLLATCADPVGCVSIQPLTGSR